MWRRHLNNEALATTTHKKPEKVSDGTSTQVISQTVDKCGVKMIQREIYNVRNPLCERDGRNSREETVATILQLYSFITDLYECEAPWTRNLFLFVSEVQFKLSLNS